MFFIIPILFIISTISILDAHTDSSINEKIWKRVYLATYPRSGNHWVRNLIEEATHKATSSVYCDQNPKHLPTPFPWGGYASENGCLGYCEYPIPGEIVIIKTHYPAISKQKFDLKQAIRIIRIVRHPLDSFYSNFLIKVARENLTEKEIVQSSFVDNSIELWKNFESYWDKRKNVVIIRYEDLFQEPHANLKKILKAAGYRFTEEDVERAVKKFPPNGQIYKHFDHYSPDDIQKVMKELKPWLKKYHYIDKAPKRKYRKKIMKF
jgi:hypothetical protein